MVLYNSKSSSHFQIQQSQQIPFLTLLRHTVFIFLLFFSANSISFGFSSFNPNNEDIQYQGDATAADGKIQVTRNQFHASLRNSLGRAYYSHPIHLWDNETGILTDFNTYFSFIIIPTNSHNTGDGLTFFLSALNATLPSYGNGGYLGLFDEMSAFDDTKNQIVAVEFDTYKNDWDPSMNHVGIDLHMIKSTTYLVLNTSLVQHTITAWVNYDSTMKNLSVCLVSQGVCLSMVVDLRKFLPEWVHVGFSAATGEYAETHSIISWTFNSTLENSTSGSVPPSNSPPGGSPPANSPSGGSPPANSSSRGSPSNSPSGGSPSTPTGHETNLRLKIGLVMSIGALSCGVGLFWFMKRRKTILPEKNNMGLEIMVSRENNNMGLDASIDDIDDFEKGTGPRRFTFLELSHATNNFSETGKLGQGGFGGVYKGVLGDIQEEIAVKRISRGSKQGKKEYVSEVKIISRLRHRNLVQLIGWCHEQGDLLLVYEFMPNGSLDTHLFGGKSKPSWTIRYKIAIGLASALLYLHEEWEQYVIHRDIKSSNIMLDSNFNAKLGDFGLARLVDHELSLEATALAGTVGYLAPECFITCKASKESDVYSFGVVALEIACGRKQIEPNMTSGHVTLLEWVWSHYGKRQLFEAVDKDLTMEYDESQVERLMLVGLWCCHPDPNIRPSIRQAINILTFEAPLPVLPSQMPKPVYSSSPICMPSYSSSVMAIDSNKDMTQCSHSCHSPSLTPKALLQGDEDNGRSLSI